MPCWQRQATAVSSQTLTKSTRCICLGQVADRETAEPCHDAFICSMASAEWPSIQECLRPEDFAEFNHVVIALTTTLYAPARCFQPAHPKKSVSFLRQAANSRLVIPVWQATI